MAGMVVGTTGALITGTIMIFEMTRDYTVIMPVIVTVAIATAVRNALSPATIYTLKLVRRGDVEERYRKDFGHLARPRRELHMGFSSNAAEGRTFRIAIARSAAPIMPADCVAMVATVMLLRAFFGINSET